MGWAGDFLEGNEMKELATVVMIFGMFLLAWILTGCSTTYTVEPWRGKIYTSEEIPEYIAAERLRRGMIDDGRENEIIRIIIGGTNE